MSDKWFFIAISVGIIVYGGQGVLKNSSFGYKVKAIEQGLEECPSDPDNSYNSKIIFVKSCKEYVDNFYKYNKKKEK